MNELTLNPKTDILDKSLTYCLLVSIRLAEVDLPVRQTSTQQLPLTT